MAGRLLKVMVGGKEDRSPEVGGRPHGTGREVPEMEAGQSLRYVACTSLLLCPHFAPPPTWGTVSMFACQYQRIWEYTLTLPPIIKTRSKP